MSFSSHFTNYKFHADLNHLAKIRKIFCLSFCNSNLLFGNDILSFLMKGAPPTPPLLLTQTRHVVDKKQKGRKNKFYNFSLVHCQFIIKLLLWTISVPDEGCSQTTPKCTTDPCNFFFLLISRFCEWTKEKRNLIFIYLFLDLSYKEKSRNYNSHFIYFLVNKSQVHPFILILL